MKSFIKAGQCAIVVLLMSLAAIGGDAGRTIVCEGPYRDHIQGVALDDDAIYWSFASILAKTDLEGKLLKSVDVPYHHGDPCLRDGRLYVPLGLGPWHREIDPADSRNWIYVYDKDLELIARHHVPEVIYGAGCIEYHDGRFYVGGGIPDGKSESFIYEYDEEFRFIRRHELPLTGKLGIQTIVRAGDSFWLGCYGTPNFCIETDAEFNLKARHSFNTAVGLAPVAVAEDHIEFLVAASGGNDTERSCSAILSPAVFRDGRFVSGD